MNDPVICFMPAAGRSERFRAAGYETPKPLLRVQYEGVTRQMYQHVMSRSKASRIGILVALPSEFPQTISQVHTILQMFDHLGDGWIEGDYSVALIDCDMLIHEEDLTRTIDLLHTTDYEALVLGIPVQNGRMSYVEQMVPSGPVYRTTQFIDGDGPGIAVASVRVFRSAAKLRHLAKCCHMRYGPMASMSKLYRLEPPWIPVGINMARQPVINWGTPELLLASGASIVEEDNECKL